MGARRRRESRASTSTSASAVICAGWCVRSKTASRWSAWIRAGQRRVGPKGPALEGRIQLPIQSAGQEARDTMLIRNGKVVTATETKIADVLIDGEVIREVRAGIPVTSAET